MPVSLDHELIVRHLIKWVNKNDKQFQPSLMLTECSLYPKCNKLPPTINGHRPDLYVTSRLAQIACLIGEGKVTKDLETSRTEIQLRAFVQYLVKIGGGYIVLGVAWNSVPSARSLLKKIVSRENASRVTVLVIDCSASLLNSEFR